MGRIDTSCPFDNNHFCGDETGISFYICSLDCRNCIAVDWGSCSFKLQEKIQKDL